MWTVRFNQSWLTDADSELVLMEDNARAKSAHLDFIALWRDADPDVPILKQAQAEYASLQ